MQEERRAKSEERERDVAWEKRGIVSQVKRSRLMIIHIPLLCVPWSLSLG
jgi:hypothetical protein